MSIQKNTAYNLLGAVLPLGLSLFTIPLYISLIGEARYGVLAIAWLLLGYFGLFDLGLGRATAQRIASLGNSSPEQLATTFWTALTMNVSLGVIGGLLIWPVAVYFFGHVFKVDPALRSELSAAIPWLVLAVPLATLSGVLTGALEGRSKFLELNLISVSSSALIQLFPLTVALLHGPDLVWLLPAVILGRLLTLSALFARCRVHVFHGFSIKVSLDLAKSLLQFGGWVTVSSLISPMMVIMDRFVIGAALGAKAVAYYTVPFQLAERSTVIAGALATALFPRLAEATIDEARRLALTAVRSLAVIMTPAILLCVLFVKPFMQWWLTPDFAKQAGLTAQILLLGFWINSFARIPYAQLQAAGRPNVVAKCHLVELMPYLALLYLGLHYWGLPGAATAFSVRTFSDCILLFWFAGNLKTFLRVIYAPAVILFISLAVEINFRDSWIQWMAWSVLIAAMAYWVRKNTPLEIVKLLFRSERLSGGIKITKLNRIILFDAHTFDMEPQGTSTFLAGLINALPAVLAKSFPNVSIDIHCAAANERNVAAYVKVPYTFHRIHTGFLSRNVLWLPQLSRRILADVVVSQYVRPIWVHKHAVSVIHDMLFFDFPSQFSAKYRISRTVLFGLSARFSQAVFTVSEYSKRRISEIYKINQNAIGILPNAITFSPPAATSCTDSNAGGRVLRLLYVSRLEQRKRHEWCLRAFEDLRLEGRNVQLTLVGRGSGNYAKKLMALLAERVELYGSSLSHLEGISQDRLNILYAQTDVFLFPSLGEGFGIPVIEAASHGVPCVVTDGSALAELSNYYAGKAFESDNYSEFLAAIKSVLDNNEYYKNDANEKIRKVVDHFSWKTTAHRFIESILALEK